MREIMNAASSEKATDHQMESPPIRDGNSSTARSWKTRVRRKEMMAETSPLLRAVKNPEANILSPARRKVGAKSRRARVVRSQSSAS